MTAPKLALRSDLELIRTGSRDFVLVDPTNGQRYQFGGREQDLLQWLDGTRSIDGLLEHVADGSASAPRARHVREFVAQLETAGLLEHARGQPAQATAAKPGRREPSGARPAGLDRTFDRLAAAFGWMIHPALLVPVLAAAGLAAAGLILDFGRYLDDLARFTGRHPILFYAAWLLGSLILVQLPRELLVGTAYRKAGGHVRSFRIRALAHLIPFFYCDVGESLRLRPARVRLKLLAIRPWWNLWVASLAALVWIAAPRGSALASAGLLLIIPSLLGIIQNAYIFMPTDGYAALCLLLRVPRLRERAQAEVQAWLGSHTSPEPLTGRERFWLRIYGLGLLLSDPVLLASAFGFSWWWFTERYGASGALVVVLAAAWTGKGLWTGAIRRITDLAPTRSGKITLGLVLQLGTLVLVILAGFIPYKYEVGGDCRIVPLHERGIRSALDDQIAEVFVADGDWVEEGALIARLAAREEEVGVLTTRAELARARANLGLLQSGARPEEIAIAEHQVELYQSQLDLLEAGSRPEEIEAGRQEVEYYRSQLDLLKAGARPEEIRIAEQQVEYERIQVEYARIELDRATSMSKDGATTSQDLDKAQASVDAATQKHLSAQDELRIRQQGARPEEIAAAEQQLRIAEERLAILEAGARPEEIVAGEQELLTAQERLAMTVDGARAEEVEAAEAEVDRLEAQLAHQEEVLALREIRSPIAGHVVTPDLEQRLGQGVKPGDLIARVRDSSKVFCEIAADEAAAVRIARGMEVKIRLEGLDGALVMGKVEHVSRDAILESEFDSGAIRSDRETQVERAVDQEGLRVVRVIARLEEYQTALAPGMTGHANVVIHQDVCWRALWRPISRFFRVEVWSWLP